MKNLRASRQCRGQPIDGRRLILRWGLLRSSLHLTYDKRIIAVQSAASRIDPFDKTPLPIIAPLPIVKGNKEHAESMGRRYVYVNPSNQECIETQ